MPTTKKKAVKAKKVNAEPAWFVGPYKVTIETPSETVTFKKIKAYTEKDVKKVGSAFHKLSPSVYELSTHMDDDRIAARPDMGYNFLDIDTDLLDVPLEEGSKITITAKNKKLFDRVSNINSEQFDDGSTLYMFDNSAKKPTMTAFLQFTEERDGNKIVIAISKLSS